ncbi:hypothetical protein JCM16814_01010 [Desulfobaculum senezii]
MRLAHISLSLEYYPGIARQRMDEARAARALSGDEWDVYVVSQHWEYGRDGVNIIMPDVPRALLGTFPGRGGRISLSGRALTLNLGPARGAFNRAVERLAPEYDVVVARYYPGEIVSTPLRHRENVIFLHHTLAVNEMGLRGRLPACVERVTGPRRQAGALAIAGVTPEIAQAEARRAGNVHWLVHPNAIEVDRFAPSGGGYVERGGPLRLVMVAGEFQPWHGLDVILERMAKAPAAPAFELHIAGQMDKRLRERVFGLSRIAWHGVLGRNEVDRLLSTADICLGSMAMHRVGLTQGSSIKVRDALARGIPVAAGCADPALPEDYPWYHRLGADWQWDDVLEFARLSRDVPRAEVSASAREHIDYVPVMRRFLETLHPLLHRSKAHRPQE